MSSDTISIHQNTATRMLNEFLSADADAPGEAWPRLAQSKPVERSSQDIQRHVRELHVLVVGDLALELPIEAEASGAELRACPCLGQETCWSANSKCRACAVCRLRVGGFVGHAVKVASRLGARVSICTNIPVPMPRPIEDFFHKFEIDRRFVTGVADCVSIRGAAHCADGCTVFGHPGAVSAIPVDLPRSALHGVDAILLNPCVFAERSGLARSMCRCLGDSPPSVVVGLRLDGRCSSDELMLAHNNRVWTFLRERDGVRLAERISSPGPALRQTELVRRLHDTFGIARLVLQLGSNGAVMQNGTPYPFHVHTCPVMPAELATAPRDTLLVVTALSSAAGADDKTSLRRGVAAATGLVAGLELPTTLEELDAA